MVNKEPEKEKNIDNLLEALQSKFGEGAIMKLGEVKKVNVEVIPTGSFSLDLALGVNGLPKGRIVEIFGPESSGKTTLALNVVAQAQKNGGKAAFIDAEHAMDPEYAAKLGVKIKELLISQPDNGEEALNILESLVRSGMIDVVVVDSVAALTPKAEIEGEMGAQYIGLQARMMSQALRKLTALAAKSGTMIIFINQLREKIGVMWGCLNYKSKVVLQDGKTEWIGRIVNQRKPLTVLSYDWKNDEIKPKKIYGWYNNGRAESFLQITAYKPSGNGRAEASVTPNHPVLTPTGWRRAEQLAVGDRVLIGVPHFLNQLQLEIIRGSLMGDGALSKSQNEKSFGVRFRIGHGKKQKDYLLWKSKFFGNISHLISTGKAGDVRFNLTPLPELYNLRQIIYTGKHKFLPADFVASLTPLSLAIWYMDDGHLDIRDKQKTKGRIQICVEAMHPESRNLLLDYLKSKYDISSRVGYCGGKAVLTVDQKNTEKFLSLVARYIHPSMSYKLLPVYRNKFAGLVPIFSQSVWKPMSTPIIDIKEKPKTRSMMRFDIGIRKTHNFLAGGIIVHNSPETTPGGRALKFYSSVRIDIRRVGQLKKGEGIIGNRVKAKVVKNKVAAPFKAAEFDILFGEGISYEGDVATAALERGVITKSGATYSLEGEKLGVGIENVKAKLKEDKKLLKAIEKKTISASQQV